MTIIASNIPNGRKIYFDQNGNPLAGGKVSYWIPGTQTPVLTYQDDAATIPNANPIILDAAGSCTALGNGAFREYVTDALGNVISDTVVVASYPQFTAPTTPSPTPTISAAMAPVVAAATTAAALDDMGFATGIPHIVVTGHSAGQTFSLAAGDVNNATSYSGGSSQLIDNTSGAKFTASIAGNTLTVTTVASGVLSPNLYVNGSGVTQQVITAQVSGTTGGAGSYTLGGAAQTVASTAMTAFTYSTAWGMIATLNNPGAQIFGAFAQGILNVTGTAVAAEFNSINNTGVNPAGAFPPGQLFGITDHIPIALQLVAEGNAQSQVALQVIPGSNSFQAGMYMWPGAASTYGIWVDASSTLGAVNAAKLVTTSAGLPLILQVKGTAVPGNAMLELANDAGNPILTLKQNGDITNAGFTIGANGFLSFAAPTLATAAAGGSATALPTNPAGFVEVIINGNVQKIPYYN